MEMCQLPRLVPPPQVQHLGLPSSRDSFSSTVTSASSARIFSRDGRHSRSHRLAAGAEDDEGVGLAVDGSNEVRGKYGNRQTQTQAVRSHGDAHLVVGELQYRQYREPQVTSRRGSLSSRGATSSGGRIHSPLSESLCGSMSARTTASSLAGVGPLSGNMPSAPASARGKYRQPFSLDEDKWLRNICEQLCQKASQRHNTVQQALRSLDTDGDGLIEKSELQYFFRTYDLPVDTVDRFLRYLGHDGDGRVDYHAFVEFMVPAIKGTRPFAPSSCGSDVSTREPSPASLQDAVTRRHAFEEQFAEMAELIRKKVEQRFTHPRDMFRFLDLSRDGRITQNEMRSLFRALNIHESIADQFLEHFDVHRCGEASYEEFVDFMRPHLEPAKDPLPPWCNTISDLNTQPQNKRIQPDSSQRAATSQSLQPSPYLFATKERDLVDEASKEELRELMAEIARVPKKYRTPSGQPASNICNKIAWLEARAFLTAFGWPTNLADRFFQFLDKDGSAEVDHSEFMKLFRYAEKLRGKRDNSSAHSW